RRVLGPSARGRGPARRRVGGAQAGQGRRGAARIPRVRPTGPPGPAGRGCAPARGGARPEGADRVDPGQGAPRPDRRRVPESAGPAEPPKPLPQAQREGLGALATLGLAASELARGKPDVAKGLFEDARDKGTPAIAHAAEYGLAATAFLGGAHKEFRQPALAELDAAPKGRGAPRLLYVLTGLAVEEKDWAGALGFAKRLASEFPVDEGADDAFESIGAAAAQAR